MLNTLKNVRILEKHVGKEIHNYMKSQPLRCVFSESRHKTESKEFIERNQLPVGTKKVGILPNTPQLLKSGLVILFERLMMAHSDSFA